MKDLIDLRSDTVTKPSEGMRKAMYDAQVGDDVYKEDPTVNQLEETVAAMFGKEAALFVPTGVMANQIALKTLTQPGDEVICDYNAHIFQYESGSPAALSGLQLSLVNTANGLLNVENVKPLIRPKEAYYMASTKVIEIENTHNRAGGIIQPLENIKALRELASRNDLYMHLDGARIWNAHVATGIALADYAANFDTLACCFSKGLGTPLGSMIVSDKEKISRAFRIRKAWGGGMRQIGVIAAAALYAIRHNIRRLAEDHSRAGILADFLAGTGDVDIDISLVHTNIIMFKPLKISPELLIINARKEGLLISTGAPGFIRLVTHLDFNDEQLAETKKIFSKILKAA